MQTVTISLGLLGILQALFLPGLCAVSCLKSWNWPQRLLFAPPLSLFLNNYLVWILFSLGWYSQSVMLAVIAMECVWIAHKTRSDRSTGVIYPRLEKPTEYLFLLLGVMALTKYFQAWVRNLGDVFQLRDAVISWNAWGRDWTNGIFPGSGLYPQALPTAFSLPYALMGQTELETFSKACMGIVFVSGIGALLELGFRRKDLRSMAWACAYIYPMVQSRFLQSHWNSGYADVPLAVMLLFSFCLSTFEGKEKVWLYGFIAGTAPLVKQPGMLFAALSPILARGWQEIRRVFWPVVLAVTLTAGPWYLFIVTRIYLLKRDVNNVSELASMVPGDISTRWEAALNLIVHFSSLSYLVICFGLAILGAITSKEARRWWLLLGLPYFFIWATFFAYDIRNLSMALFPFALAISAGIVFGITRLEEKVPRTIRSLSKCRDLGNPFILGRAIIALTLLLGLISFFKPFAHWQKYGSILGWEVEQRRYLGDSPKSNLVFARLIECQETRGTSFLTNYDWTINISGIKGKAELVDCQRIREEIVNKGKSYVLLYEPFCELDASSPPTIFADAGLRIFATNSSLPVNCDTK